MKQFFGTMLDFHLISIVIWILKQNQSVLESYWSKLMLNIPKCVFVKRNSVFKCLCACVWGAAVTADDYLGCFLCKKVIYIWRERNHKEQFAVHLLLFFRKRSLEVDNANDFWCLHSWTRVSHAHKWLREGSHLACVPVCEISPLKHPLAAGSADCFCKVSTYAYGGWLKIQRSAWQTSQTKHTHKHMLMNDAHWRKNAN